MKFTKMQGIGNDYIYVNCFDQSVINPSELAKIVSDRHFGVGSDGLIMICPSEAADCKMTMFNADGSEAQMCGNGIRCVGKYVYERGLVKKDVITVETACGVKTLRLNIHGDKVKSVKVDMGEPELKPELIPVKAEGSLFIRQLVDVDGKRYEVTCVSMDNPHAVVFLKDIDGLDILKLGPKFENHPLFPERINTEFVEVMGESALRMRVWERGAGETLACGTGACAALVAANLCGFCDRSAMVVLKGGSLEVEWDGKTNHVFMTGPAEFVFDGELI